MSETSSSPITDNINLSTNVTTSTQPTTPIAVEIYNKVAERYASKVDLSPWNAGLERPTTLSLLPTELKGKYVLDAACGPGFYSEYLINHGAEVLGLDVSSSMIVQYQKRIKDKAKVIEHDLSKPLTFIKNEEFDLVLSPLTLHYLPEWNSVFKEIFRILKSGALWVFSIPHPAADFYDNRKKNMDTNYFEIEYATEKWSFYGEPVIEMKIIKRPLQMLFTTLLNTGFILEKFVEAQPTERFKELAPTQFDIARKTPSFISVRVRKP